MSECALLNYAIGAAGLRSSTGLARGLEQEAARVAGRRVMTTFGQALADPVARDFSMSMRLSQHVVRAQ
jgi:hypothetical protein